MGVILECKGLVKKYGKKTALKGIDLSLEGGRIIGLLGPNGSGKTTFIKLANGLLKPTQGEIVIDGKKIGKETKGIVSYLPERTYLDNDMKVKEVVMYFKDLYADFNENAAKSMLEKLKIDMNDKLKTMSKGTKEKVQLILVMSRNAKLYFLDEPIGGVDPAARDYIIETIITNYNPEASVIISTHLITDIEKILDEVVMLKEGEVVMHEHVDEIRAEEGKSIDALFREVFKC